MAQMTASCGSLQSVKKSIMRCVTGEFNYLFGPVCTSMVRSSTKSRVFLSLDQI